MMNNNLSLTPEEAERLDWCLSVLEEEQVVECEYEANGIAWKEANSSEAYVELLSLLVKMRVHEWEPEQK